MEKKYLGMTVNERLFVSGLMEEFDVAIAQNNYKKAKELLRKVELTDESILPILKSLGLALPIEEGL